MNTLVAGGGVGLILGGMDVNKTQTTGVTIFNSSSTVAGLVQLNGATINAVANTLIRLSGSANLTLAGVSTGTLGLRLGGTNGIFDVTNGRTLTINSVISEPSGTASGFTKTGTSTLSLGGANTFSGTVTVNAGVLSLNNSSALGTGSLSLGSGANQVRLALADMTINRPATVSGGGGGTTGEGLFHYAAGSGTGTWSGNITINGSPTLGGIFGSAAGGELVVSGNVTSASAIVNVRTGTVTFSGSNSFPKLLGNDGEIKVGSTSAIPATAAVEVGNGTSFTSRFNLNGFSGTAAVLLSSGSTATVTNNGASAATLTLTGSTINSVPFTVISRSGTGTMTLSSGSSGLTVSLNAGSNVPVIDNSTAVTVSATLGSANGLTKTGAGTLTLSANNSSTLSGVITGSAGTIVAQTPGALGSGTVALNGATLTFNTTAGTYTNPITTSVATTINATGTNVTLSGPITIGGETTFYGSGAAGNRFTLNNANALTSTNNSNVIFRLDSSQNSSVSGIISIGAGSVTKLSTATLTLSNASNSFSGGLNQNGSGGGITISANGAQGSGTIAFGSGGSGPVTFSNVSGTIANDIVANGGTGGITKSGASTTTLTGANTYAGTTTVSAGTLVAGGTSAFGAAAGTIVVSGGALDLGGLGITRSGTVSLTGGTIQSGTLTNDTVAFDLQAGTASAVLAGSAGVAKTTSGTVTLTGANIFTGDTTVLGGILVLGETISIQNSAFDTGASIAGDATNGLRAGIGGTGVTTLTLGGLKGANDFSSRFTTTTGGYANLTGLTLNPGAGVSNTYSGDIGNGAGNLALTKAGSGTQILAGTNTFTGVTTISGGVLVLGSQNALGGNNPGVNGTVSISMAAGTTLRSGTTAGSITNVFAPITLSGAGTISFLVGAGAASTTTTYNLNSAISGTTGNVVFSTGTSTFSNGTSLVVLNAASTYSGTTQISTGNGGNNPVYLRNGVANALPTTTVLAFDQVAGGGTGRVFQYDLNGFNQTLAGLDNGGVVPSLRRMLVTSTVSAATLTISGSTNTQFGGADLTGGSTNRAQIQGAIALTKDGTGTFTLGGTLAGGATVGGNIFTGDTTVLGGILVLGETISIQNSAFDTGASIAGDAANGLRAGIGGTGVTTLTLGGLKGANDFSSRFTTTTGGYANLTGLTLNPGAGVSNTYSGDIGNGAGNLALTKTGSGTQILAGTNTFTGGVTISAGTLTLSGSNTYEGVTTVDAGVVRITNAGALGSTAAGVVVNGTTTGATSNARLELSGGITVTGESATLRGNGNFWGALQSFSGTNEWAGNVTIDAIGTRIGSSSGASLLVSGVIDDGVNDYRLMYRIADAAASVTLTGANTYTGGSTIVGPGPVIVGSLNSVVGGSAASSLGAPTTEENGRIFIGTTTTGGVLRYVGTGETTDRTIQVGDNSSTPVSGDTGGATIESSGASGALVFSSGTFNVPTNAATGTSPARTLTLGGSNTGTNTISGVIQNNQVAGSPTAAVNVTKTGAGSWTLAAANTYTGTTTVDGGTLAFSTVDQSLAGGLTIGGTAGAPITGILDLSAASATFGGAFVARTENSTAAASTITIGAGRSLTLGNGMTVGFDSGTNTVSKLNVVGSGTLNVTAGNFQLGGSVTTNVGNAATLDMSGLATFRYTVSSGTFQVGDATNSGGGGAGSSTLILADTSIITATTVTTNAPTFSSQVIKLGRVSNTINANSIAIGQTTNRAGAFLSFSDTTGTLTVRNTAGTGRASMTVAYGNASTGGGNNSSVDLTGADHSADLLLSTLQIAGRTATGSASGNSSTRGVFSFENGTLDVTGITLGLRGARAAGGTAVAVSGTLNLGGGSVTIGASGINAASNASLNTGDTVVGTINISRGTVVIGATGGTSITLGSNTSAANAGSTATLNLTGGTTTLSGDIARGTATGVVNSVLVLDGFSAVLDMGGRNITNLTDITYAAGTLKNLGTVNTGLTLAGAGSRLFDQGVGISGTIQGIVAGSGVGLTKQGAGTLVLNGVTTYSGATSITGGLLAVGAGGSINATSGIVIDGGGLRYNNASTALTQAISFGAAGGSISGTGVIGTPLVFGTAAVLSPGNSPGTITGTAGVAWDPGGTYEWELNALSGTAGTNWDLLSVTAGGLDLTDLSTSARFTLKLITLTASNTAGPLAVGYVPGDPYEFLIAGYDSLTVPGSFSTAANSDLTGLFTINLDGWQGTQPALADISVKVNSDATGIVLVLVPEPGTVTALWIGLATAGFMVRRRRRVRGCSSRSCPDDPRRTAHDRRRFVHHVRNRA